jgi:hypothetical protein
MITYERLSSTPGASTRPTGMTVAVFDTVLPAQTQCHHAATHTRRGPTPRRLDVRATLVTLADFASQRPTSAGKPLGAVVGVSNASSQLRPPLDAEERTIEFPPGAGRQAKTDAVRHPPITGPPD